MAKLRQTGGAAGAGAAPRQYLPQDPMNPNGPLRPDPQIVSMPTDASGGVPSQSSQSPAERQPGLPTAPPSPGGAMAAPPQPRQPSPISMGQGGQNGQPQEQAVPSPSGQPFTPLPSMSPDSLVTPRVGRRSLYGGEGGQLGGGMGVPFDPTSNNQSDSISSLIQALLSGGARRGY